MHAIRGKLIIKKDICKKTLMPKILTLNLSTKYCMYMYVHVNTYPAFVLIRQGVTELQYLLLKQM